jgi:two-component system, NtrC family, sensor kinase
VPLRNGNQCVGCHENSQVLASIITDYPSIQVNGILAGDRWRLAGYAVMVLVLVLLLLWTVCWWLVLEPLYRLTHAVGQVRQGDLEAECELTGPDQFARLADGFNEMLRHLRARQQDLRKGYEHDIARAERLATVGQLASGLAHEIKNPLHGVAGALEIIASRLPDRELKEVTQEMKLELERVVQIINDLLSYARPKPANQCATNLLELVKQAMRLLGPDAKARQITLQCHMPADLPQLWVDPEKLRQILLNLMLNALQFGHPGGRLTVSAWLPTGARHLIIEVDDDGPGISAAHQERLFEPFFTTRTNGHGLGLSISRFLAEQHGGSLTLYNRPGPGACFRLQLPILSAAPAMPSKSQTDRHPHQVPPCPVPQAS